MKRYFKRLKTKKGENTDIGEKYIFKNIKNNFNFYKKCVF